MDAAILADNDDGVLEQCERLLLRLPLVQQASHEASVGLDAASNDVVLVPRESKTSFVRRLAACDGPLACHAIQECLHRYVCICAAAISRRNVSPKRELDEWFASVLETVMDCIRAKVCWGEGTAAQRLRCAIILLQLLSNILKAERGASHPERASNASASQAANTTTASSTKKAASTTSDENDCTWEREAAKACARASSVYLGSMVKAAATLKARGQGGDDDRRSEHIAAAALDGEDAGFWVFAFLSDVLKCLRKDGRSRGDSTLAEGYKRALDGEARGVKGVSRPPPSVAAAAGKADVSGDDGRRSGSSGLAVDVSGLAKLVAAFPVERGKRAMDLALKWLEVTTLMMEAAETRRDGVLADILRSVPPTLWRLVIPTGSLLPAKEPLPSPGCAFVEPDGAHGALAQAMLTLVFRIVRRGDVPDSLVVPGVEISDGYRENRDGNREATGGGGREERPPGTRPWSTAAEALAATARASADAGADGDGDGDGDADAWMGFAGRLVRLFSDQDDALIDMLLQNLYIFHNTQPARDEVETIRDGNSIVSPGLRNLYHGVLHPGVFFSALLSEVRFDSGVLLDWLISPETRFLQYLTMLLRLAVAEWSDFAVRVSFARASVLESVCGVGKPAARAEERDKIGGKEREEEGEEEEELVLSEEEAEQLGKVVSCLSGLVASARGLEKNGLVPYSLAPLLRRIDQVVSLYEDCGDADEGEGGDETISENTGCTLPHVLVKEGTIE